MPIVCVNRPNRTIKRRFTPRDLGRIACYVKRDGATTLEMRRELEKCIPGLCKGDPDSVLKQILPTLKELLTSIALARFGGLTKFMRIALQRTAIGRSILNALEDFGTRTIGEIEKVIQLIERQK